jgi:hypothetical protein
MIPSSKNFLKIGVPMRVKPLPFFTGALLTFLIISACGFTTPTPDVDPNAIFTQAAQTISVQLTESAETNTPLPPGPPTSPAASATATQVAASATPLPTATNTLPPTPIPPTATNPPTPTPIPCDWAQFVKDVTVADGTVMTPGSVFTKTWRLKNIGTCTWTGRYDLIFVEGDRMEAPRSLNLRRATAPGETIDISVVMVAPEKAGRHRAYFMLRSEDGEVFGIGAGAGGKFWAEIKVSEPNTDFAYDFGLNYCVGEWSSDSGLLDCPGRPGNEDGFVVLLDNPETEKERPENEIALWTQPENRRDGWIRGQFPAIRIRSGYHFRTVVGCLSDAPNCNVIFRMRYRLEDGDWETLWETQQIYDGDFTKVNIDLGFLADEKVEFALVVLTNGSPRDDKAFWLLPRIVDED